MDPFHERLARVALDAAGSFGFALAGGYAVQAHGFLNRMSADVNLFAETSEESDITQAVDVVIAAYRRDGLQVEAEVRSASFARLDVKSAVESAKVELGLDWRRAGLTSRPDPAPIPRQNGSCWPMTDCVIPGRRGSALNADCGRDDRLWSRQGARAADTWSVLHAGQAVEHLCGRLIRVLPIAWPQAGRISP